MNWEKVKLGNVCQINPSRPKEIDDQLPVTFLAMADVSEEGKILNKQHRAYEEVKKGFTSFIENDILIAKITPCFENGKSAKAISLSNGIGFGSTEFHVIRPTDKVLSDYIFYATRSHKFRLGGKKSMTGSAGQQRVPTSFIQEFQIPLPNLPTQQHIAAVLDKADALRQQNRRLLTYYDELLQSTFIELFGDPVTNEKGWEVKKLEDLCSDIVDCPHSTPNHDSTPTEYPSIRTTELKNGSIDWSSMKYVQYEEYLERTKRLVPCPGDIVYGREGSFGEAVIIPKGVTICLGQRVMLFRPDFKLCGSTFLWAMVRNEYVYNQAVRKTSGSTVGHVNVKDIKQFDVFLPPLPLQNHFADIVEKIETQKEQARAALAESEALFEGLLAGYFGEN